MENNQEKKTETSEKSENTETENLENFQKPSYTYWKRESDKPFSNEFTPQKSDPLIVNDSKLENNNNAGSAWNKAGTW
jgi:hypothetical protein